MALLKSKNVQVFCASGLDFWGSVFDFTLLSFTGTRDTKMLKECERALSQIRKLTPDFGCSMLNQYEAQWYTQMGQPELALQAMTRHEVKNLNTENDDLVKFIAT